MYESTPSRIVAALASVCLTLLLFSGVVSLSEIESAPMYLAQVSPTAS